MSITFPEIIWFDVNLAEKRAVLLCFLVTKKVSSTQVAFFAHRQGLLNC